MRSLLRAVLPAALAAAAIFIGAGQPVLAGGGNWSFEARAAYINPVKGDGTLDGLAHRTEVDFLKAIVPEIAAAYRASDRFTIGLAIAKANFDVEFDIDTAGEFDLGESDALLLSLEGMFDVTTIGETDFQFGIVLTQASFDDVDLSNAAVAENLRRVTMDSALLYGFSARFDTPIGADGWYFTSNLRYLMGGPDMSVERYNNLVTPVVIGSGSADFDPLTVSIGFGFHY